MREIHHFLTAHFTELSGERAGLPLYFIEHGLNELDTEDLILQVSEKCSVHPLTSFEWQLSPLPIIIAATEVGYSYQGPGHDFWPKFDERLGIVTSFEEHILGDRF